MGRWNSGRMDNGAGTGITPVG